MAVVNFTIESVTMQLGQAIVVTWPNMKTTDTGSPYQRDFPADTSFQLDGTPGLSGSIRVEGTNYTSAEVWQSLGTAGAAALSSLQNLCVKIRPVVVGGDVTTNWNVKLFLMLK